MAGDHADISKHVKMYIAVLMVLVVGTVVTVVVAKIVIIPHPWNYVVGLLIATVKASFVAAIFMHLKWEKTVAIWGVLGLCAVFFVFLVFLPVLTVNDYPPQVELTSWSPALIADAPEAHSGH